MGQPTRSDVHYDAVLSNISTAIIQDPAGFVAPQIFPIVPVDKQSNKYVVWDKEAFLRDDMKVRPSATESAGTAFKLSRDAYYCDKYALHYDIADDDRANSDDGIDLERTATRLLTHQTLQRLERAMMTDFLTTGKWGQDYTGVSGAPGANQFKQWNDAASTPITDIDKASDLVLSKTGLAPNTFVLGQQAYRQLQRHAVFKDQFKYVSAESITPELIGAVLDIPRVIVAKAIKATNTEGQTTATDFIVGKVAWLGYVDPNPGLEVPTAGLTFNWRQSVAGNLAQAPVYQFRMDELKADRIETEIAFDMKVVSADLGTFFTSAVA
jgi:hypothetical protein